MSKIRLVGGPFGGKVIDDPKLYGRNEIIYRGPKKMTRKRRLELMSDPNYYPMYHLSATGAPGGWKDPRMIDGMVEARYKVAMHPHSPTLSNWRTGIHEPFLPAMHPDGSIFYEYVEGTRKDLN